jgi:hypothetical protein
MSAQDQVIDAVILRIDLILEKAISIRFKSSL